MSNEVYDFNIGHSTAYAYAKASGDLPEGMTPEEYGELLASYATVGQTAVTAAQTATTKASEAATSATTATNKASEATTAATTATTKAGEASTSASTATSAKDTAVSASQTATTKATEATTAAATAVSAKDDAVAANTAAQSAKTAAQTAQTGAETAAASVQSSAAQIATNASDISQLKSEFTDVNAELADVRVGADGTTYNSAGAAVRGQISDLKEDVNALDDTVGIKQSFTNITGYVSIPAKIKSGIKYFVDVTSGTLKLYTRATSDGANIDTIIGTTTTAPATATFTATANASFLRVLADASSTFTIIEDESISKIVSENSSDIEELKEDVSDIEGELENVQSFSCRAGYESYPAIIEKDKTYIVRLTSGKARIFTRATSDGENIDYVIGDMSASSAKTAPYITKFTATANASYLRVAADTAVTFTVEDCSTIKGQLELLNYDGVFGLFEYKESIYPPYPQIPANDDTESDFDSDNMTAQDIYDYIDALMAKYPQLLSKTVMGKDASNTYDVNRYVFADSTRSDYLATIYIGANEHGPSSDPRECAIVVCRFLKDLCEGHAKTNRVLNILKKYYRIVSIPVANPWGFNTNHRNNANNVNINRNYPTVPGWENCTDADKGSAPASEVETQYIVNTISTYNPQIALDLHCLGYVTQANDMKCAYAGVVKNQALIDEIVKSMKRDYNLTCTVYGQGDYTTHSDGDSYFAYLGIDGMLLEFQARDGITGSADAVLHSANIMEANYTFMLRIINYLLTVYNADLDIMKV